MSIDIATLKSGCYRLTRPLENPRPDRRSKEWRSQFLIPAMARIEHVKFKAMISKMIDGAF